ncbi:hypothetical protein ES705_32105 [subsurface metagenome]
MKKKLNSGLAGLLVSLLIIVPSVSNGQSEKAVIKKYLRELTTVPVSNTLQKYRMTAVYTNMDLYGTFTGKTKVTGDYTRGLENGFVSWNNIYVSGSNNFSEPFPAGTNQEYMENIKYVPSPKMLDVQAFKDFPAGTEAVFSRNLIWDMMAIEGFAWDHTDSLELNMIYRIPIKNGEFNMSDIGTYSHAEIQLCWTGISAINDELFAVIEYSALDNKVELSMENLKTKGTEQYWGTVWVSLKTRLIGCAVMYGGTMQEIEVTGLDNKFLVKTIRELWVEKIQ